MYSLNEIKENYRSFSDSKIENIAKNESKGLRPEVLVILKDEIIKRKLNPNLINWIATEAKPYKGKERDILIEQIKSQPCPKCSNTDTELYGFETTIVRGLLLVTNIQKNELILCRQCGINAKSNALFITFFTGWWSKGGFLSTPFVIATDLINFLFIDKISKRVINKFIDEINGSLRRYGVEDRVIIRLIKWRNKTSL